MGRQAAYPMRISSESDGMDVASPSQLVGNGTFQVQKAIMVLLDCQYTLQKHRLSSRLGFKNRKGRCSSAFALSTPDDIQMDMLPLPPQKNDR